MEYLIKIFFVYFSPPDLPSQHEFHRLPSKTSMTLHQIDPTTKISSSTLTNDDHNGSFEDDDIDDEHSHNVDHPDSQQINGGTIHKAYALYDFNGKNIFL